MNRGILIVACLLVVGGVGAWAAGVFESEKADASAGQTQPSVNETGGAMEAGGAVVDDRDSCGGCPVMGGGADLGGGLSVVSEGGCPASCDVTKAAEGEAPAAMALPCDGCGKTCDEDTCKDCSGDCSDKSSCGGGGCGDKGSCGGGGCGDKGSCGGGGGSGCGDKEKSSDGQ